jgi:hypothetical protein
MFIATLSGNIAIHVAVSQEVEENKSNVSSLFENNIRPLTPEEEKRKIKENYSNGILPELTQAEAEAVAKTEVDLELYYKAAGFCFEDRNFYTLLNYGTYQLRAEVNDWETKLRAADEFDKSGIQKQLDKIAVKAREKQEEIKSKTFYQEYDDCSPSNVETNRHVSSFTLHVGKGFIPIGRGFGKFLSPFPNVKAEIQENHYGDIEVVVAKTTNRRLPRWNTITISGDTDSIKILVRGMRDNPKAYSLKLWFQELQGTSNERVGLDWNNPFGARRWTEFLVVAKIVKIEIIDKTNGNKLSPSD